MFCDIPTFNEGKWRARSAQHVVEELTYLEENGYGSVYFVDDHFLLQPKRIEAICKGVIGAKLSIQWGIEGRVDSVAQHLFPAMAQAHCRTVMFGIESGSQKILDRLHKKQTLEDVATAVHNAKKAGIEIVHGFFIVGNPDETVEDMQKTFEFAARLPLDTFGFNRLCVYRGTPLWQEYLRRFLRYMPLRDVAYLIINPFLGQRKGATKAEVLSRAVEHVEMEEAAAQLTQLSDEHLPSEWKVSKVERLRIQQEAEGLRELPRVPSR